MAKQKWSIQTPDHVDARKAVLKMGQLMEQRVAYYGGEFAREAAESVLEGAKEIIDAETSGTGHLRDSGIVRKVGAGETNTGRYYGTKGQSVMGSSFTNTSGNTAYVVSFNTMRTAMMRVYQQLKRKRGDRILPVPKSKLVRINKKEAISTGPAVVTIESNRIRRGKILKGDTVARGITPQSRAVKSSALAFNYAIIVHEGNGTTRIGINFLKRAYNAKRAELASKFKTQMREAFNIKSRGNFGGWDK